MRLWKLLLHWHFVLIKAKEAVIRVLKLLQTETEQSRCETRKAVSAVPHGTQRHKTMRAHILISVITSINTGFAADESEDDF